MTSKKEIRQIYKAKRELLGPEGRSLLSAKITENVLLFLSLNEIQHIHLFLPIHKLNEIDTFPLIRILLEQGKEVYTSRSDLINGQMETVKVAVDQQFILDKNGIPIPDRIEHGRNSLLQLIFLPLLAYDLNGHRIGYGRGFYDQFLTSLSFEVLKVGLSFFPAEIQIPTEIHDIRLDFCINPEEVIEFK